ncbi:Hemolysin, plasmid [Roseivivax jejudonensis]|uniref:Hemolysin, plasmid n=1 Tax=Roseivivax jejudonensis TaxID=1529041 RepID=A0A1X6Y3W2_9RHOB|nr:calcium-binding protein [Roseivivax jejudonensis]SLN09956.1 Hemolysin, plasmid [Roseivivax jejudonensis]
MTYTIQTYGPAGGMADARLFGGNVLAPRGAMTGDGSYAEAIDQLGVTDLRYPGGSLTEFYFDISDPDATRATHGVTGEVIDFIPLSEFMAFAGANGHAVNIVIPTRDQLSDRRDADGHRVPQIDESELRAFVRDVAGGAYGDARVASFEIGNEYWGSGMMSAAEYGRLAAEMATVIDEELARVPGGEAIEIAVQMGTNFNHSNLSAEFHGMAAPDILAALNAAYDLDLGAEVVRGNGEVNWGLVANRIVMQPFDTAEEISAVDAIVAHVYSKEPAVDGQRDLDLTTIRETWGADARFEGTGIHVTEWSQSGSSGHFDDRADYGLHQAHEMLNIVEAFMAQGVTAAQVWPLIQNTPNALSSGFEFTALNAPGVFFRMMADALPGKTMVDLDPADRGETEAQLGPVHVHAFSDANETVVYIASDSARTETTRIDLSDLLSGPALVHAILLGVADGAEAGHNRSEVQLEELAAASVYEDGIVTATLAEGEILQLRIFARAPSEAVDTPTPHAADPREPAMPERSVTGNGDDRVIGGTGNDTIGGKDGNDDIDGAAGNDLLGGGLGTDTLTGNAGADTIGGGFGDDLIYGNDGADRLAGGAGGDFLVAGTGNDTVGGSYHHDRIIGDDGDDSLGGGTGRDVLHGEAGNDSLGGGEGDDTVIGGDGDDFLAGGGRDDRVWGGAGADTINGGDGDDVLVGGTGADVFVFNDLIAGERDQISDFALGADLIRLSGVENAPGSGLAGRFEALSLHDTPTGAVVEYAGHRIELSGVRAADLGVDDFLFV